MPTQLHHPFSPEGIRDPYPVLAAYRRLRPAHFDRGMNMWLLTGYRECREALRNPAFSAAAGQQQRAREDALPVSMLNTDGDEHLRLRTPATAAFSVRATERLAAALFDIGGRLLATLPPGGSGAEVEVVTALAQPYAVAVLATLLELPSADWPEFGALAAAASANLNPTVRGDEAVRAARASRALNEFLERSCRFDVGDGLTPAEKLGIQSLTVVGGYEPLAIGVATALHLLLQRPPLLRQVQANPALLPGVVDEALRFESPIPFTARVCVDGFHTGTVELPAGAAVLALVGAANRDPLVFTDPDLFDPYRNPNPHLALGGGPHFCLGAPLVRRAMAAVLELVLTERPQVRPAPEKAPRWRTSLVPRGLADLPVVW